MVLSLIVLSGFIYIEFRLFFCKVCILSSLLDHPTNFTLYKDGNIIFADTGNNRIRMLVKETGQYGEVSYSQILTIAGTGEGGECDTLGECNTGDGGQAIEARLHNPTGVAVDGDGNIFIADSGNNRIRMITYDTLIISHVAGNSEFGRAGDTQESELNNAQKSELKNPLGVAVDGAGSIFIADTGNHKIRKIDKTSVFTTHVSIEGVQKRCTQKTPSNPSCTDLDTEEGTPASDATLWYPSDVAVDSEGNLFIADTGNKAIRIVQSEGDSNMIYNLAGDLESFGTAVEGRDELIVSDVITYSIIRLSGFLPPPVPTGQFQVHR
jgi:DNA-binding beta-propeller fold protein YncE